MDFGGEFRFNFGGDDASAASKSEASGNDKGAEAKDDAETPALPGEELQVEVKVCSSAAASRTFRMLLTFHASIDVLDRCQLILRSSPLSLCCTPAADDEGSPFRRPNTLDC